MPVIALAVELIRLGLPLAAEIIAAVNTEMALSGSSNGATAEQQATIDVGLDVAHAALQAAQQGQNS